MATTVVSVYIPKGGNGKTLHAVTLARLLVTKYNVSVVLVDGDPQASATSVLMGDNFVDTRGAGFSSAALMRMMPDHPVDVAIRVPPFSPHDSGSMYLIPTEMKKMSDYWDMVVTNTYLSELDAYRESAKFLSGPFHLVNMAAAQVRRAEGASSREVVVLFDLSPCPVMFTKLVLGISQYVIAPCRVDRATVRALGVLDTMLRESVPQLTGQVRELQLKAGRGAIRPDLILPPAPPAVVLGAIIAQAGGADDVIRLEVEAAIRGLPRAGTGESVMATVTVPVIISGNEGDVMHHISNLPQYKEFASMLFKVVSAVGGAAANFLADGRREAS